MKLIADLKSVAERVAYARSLTGLDQKDFAPECGITQQGLSKIETGKTLNPSADTLRKIAQRTGVSIEWLANGGGDIHGSKSSDTDQHAEVSPTSRVHSKDNSDAATQYILLIDELELAFNSSSLSQEAIRSFRDLLRLVKAQNKNISSNPEADATHLGLGAKRLAKSERLNHPEDLPGTDKNDELDAD